MHVNNFSLPRPPEEILGKCQLVVVNDPAFRMWAMKQFCREQDLSLIWSELVDTSDVSAFFDEAAAFYFIDAKDATLFRLKYK